jgi:hypothetical protein
LIDKYKLPKLINTNIEFYKDNNEGPYIKNNYSIILQKQQKFKLISQKLSSKYMSRNNSDMLKKFNTETLNTQIPVTPML